MQANRHTWGSEKTISEFWIGYYANLLRPFVEEHDEQRLFLLARTVAEEFDKHTSWQTYSDVLPTLEALKAKNYTLGVISDWGIALGPILSQLKLTPYFDCLVVSAITRHAKPSPQLYDLALQRANSIADYTVHIGDSYTLDVLGARSVGIRPILLDRRGYIQENDVDCLLVHSLTELLDLLEVSP
jgi:putative hydrolase of the HAD superfamily